MIRLLSFLVTCIVLVNVSPQLSAVASEPASDEALMLGDGTTQANEGDAPASPAAAPACPTKCRCLGVKSCNPKCGCKVTRTNCNTICLTGTINLPKNCPPTYVSVTVTWPGNPGCPPNQTKIGTIPVNPKTGTFTGTTPVVPTTGPVIIQITPVTATLCPGTLNPTNVTQVGKPVNIGVSIQ